MADLVLEISDNLYKRLIRSAETNGVSLRDEVLLCINNGLGSPCDDEELLNSSAEVEVAR